MRANFLKNKDSIEVLFKISQSLLLGMLGALIVLLFMGWMAPKPKAIATVNITGLTQRFIKKEQEKNIPPEAIKKEALLFGKNLEKTLNEFAETYHLVLLPTEAVISGSTDYTDEIIKVLDRYVGQDSQI